MKRSFPGLVAVVALALLAGLVPALAFKVDVTYDPAVNFHAYRTYGWKSGTPARRSEADRLITRMIERELKARGLKRSEGEADVFVITHVLADAHSLADLSDASYWAFWSGLKTFDPMQVEAGTLVIDLLDADSKKIVWRGLAAGTLSEKMSKNERRVEKAIGRLFKEYPPPRPSS